jgi:hypothetical protein
MLLGSITNIRLARDKRSSLSRSAVSGEDEEELSKIVTSLKISSDCFSLGSFWNSSKVKTLDAMTAGPRLLSKKSVSY